ncbi:MAG: DUF5134 domain-containing protein [Candidatus Dormiibacterota bacterium]
MLGPQWLAGAFAGVMVAMAAYRVGRLVRAALRRNAAELDVDIAQVAMGVAMGGMLVPSMAVVGRDWWEVAFAAFAAWFAYRTVRLALTRRATRQAAAHHAALAVTCGAMAYMLAAVSPPGGGAAGMGGMSMPGPTVAAPAVAALLTVFMVGYAVWSAVRLTRLTTRRRDCRTSGLLSLTGTGAATLEAAAPFSRGALAQRRLLADQAGTCCQIAMCATMGYLLITML